MVQKLGLDEKIIAEIIRLIRGYKEPEKVYLFGSRACGDFVKTSDIDIAIVGSNWTNRDFNIVRNMLEEGIKTAFKFDVIDLGGITKKELKDNILRKGRLIYES